MAKDRRLYARFDINMDEHQKLVVLSDAAFRALFEATFYSRRQLSDGFLHERIVMRKWGAEVASELSSNDPERPSWVRVDNGWQIHDFAEHQVTSADIEAKREAGRAGGLAKAANAASKALAPATEKPLQTASTTLAKTETETETETIKKTSAPAAPSPEFDSFWKHYPKKKGKIAARKAFDKAVKLTDIANIRRALHVLNQEARGKDPQFTPHPATWLNEGRWDDEPTQQQQPAPAQVASQHGWAN